MVNCILLSIPFLGTFSNPRSNWDGYLYMALMPPLSTPCGKIRSGAPKGGLMLNSDLSPAAPQGGWEPPIDKARVVSTRRLVLTNRVSGRTLQPSIESIVANSFVPSDFLVDGQVSRLGTVHPLLTLNFIAHGFSSSNYVFNVEEEVVIIRNGWTPKNCCQGGSQVKKFFGGFT